MAKVAFKKGLLANLPAAISEGTFYVTTDERALYLDVDDTTRVRVGDFQEFETLTVTVLEVRTVSVLIEEDEGEHPHMKGGHFYWNQRCFDYIVEGGKEDTKKPSSNSNFSFVFCD